MITKKNILIKLFAKNTAEKSNQNLHFNFSNYLSNFKENLMEYKCLRSNKKSSLFTILVRLPFFNNTHHIYFLGLAIWPRCLLFPLENRNTEGETQRHSSECSEYDSSISKNRSSSVRQLLIIENPKFSNNIR